MNVAKNHPQGANSDVTCVSEAGPRRYGWAYRQSSFLRQKQQWGALRPPIGRNVRRRPTLPPRHQGSTIGAEGLSFRVRNGTGRFPFAIAAETLWRYQSFPTVSREPHSERVAKKYVSQVLGLLVPVSSVRHRTSTSGLSTQSSSWGPYQVNPVRALILKRASRLDAFSGYHFRT